MRWAVAFVWLATGLGVAHPYYRAVGTEYLDRIAMPSWLMVATCLGEVALAVVVARVAASSLLSALQVAAIAVFTVILALAEPMLLASPFGFLTKNIPIVALISVAWMIERDGWSRRAEWILRVGMAAIWVTEGLFPKILFQQPVELALAAQLSPIPVDPSTFLTALGAAQAASGVAALVLRGRPLAVLLWCQIAGLVLLPAIVSAKLPLLWFHPFGPMIKNVPILVGTLIVVRRCSSPR